MICKCKCKDNGFCQILLKAFKKDESPERQKLDKALWTRAWLMSCLVNIFKIYLYFTGRVIWDGFLEDKEDLDYKEGIVEKIIPTFNYIE